MQSVKNDISFILIILAFSFLVGCSHKVLSVFFDGVPESNDSARMVAQKASKKTDSLLIAEATGNTTGLQNSVHPPFLNKKCALCHDQNSRDRLQSPQPGLCYVCHDDFSQTFKYVHGPAAGGYCTSCHSPHKSEFKKLLIRQGQDLCLFCHDLKQVMKVPDHGNIGDTDCTSCHNPHGGNTKDFLTDKK